MARVWVGCAAGPSFKGLIGAYIDRYAVERPEHEDDLSPPLLVTEFGAASIGQGDYEVYAREHYPDKTIDAAFSPSHTPFRADTPGQAVAVTKDTTAVFFVINPAEPTKRRDGVVTITDVLDVKLDWV